MAQTDNNVIQKGAIFVNPFLLAEEKKNSRVGVIVEHRSEAGKEVPMGLQIAAEELVKAVESKDAVGAAMALRNAFMLLDAMPHEEGEHEEG